MSDESGPAFPINDKLYNGSHHRSYPGMTPRDYFAAQAMGVVLGKALDLESPDPGYPRLVAELAYNVADAMLKERNK